MTGNLLDLDRVVKQFSEGGLLSRRHVTAVQDVSFALNAERPEIFAIVGESGSGKSTLARMILGSEAPTSGALRFRGRNIATIRKRADREAFMAQVQPVFQNPFEAFNPLTRLDAYLFATARRFRASASRSEAQRLADEALHRVGLSLAEILGRFPHELSGGQLQRASVARALISKPRLIVADEPVSMIDASLRMSIVNLFRALRDDLKVSIVYITHDLATTYYISDRIIIMQKGVVVESGAARAVLDAPGHPYSIALRNAVLPPDPALAAAMVRPRTAELPASPLS
jgi:peptide/nickel transport system ATP-binding protein